MIKKNVLKPLWILLPMLCLMTAGCGKEAEMYRGEYYAPNFVSDLNVKLTSADRIYLRVYSGPLYFQLRASGALDRDIYCDTDSAICKRLSTKLLCWMPFSYKLLNYQEDGSLSANFLVAMRLDAASNFIYNLGSLCLIPRRLIISPRVSTGLFDWLKNIAMIAWDTILALVMLFVGPVIGFVCHPWESLANLTVGILYIPTEGLQYCQYVKHTNLIMSIWDLLKLLYSILVRTILFWV